MMSNVVYYSIVTRRVTPHRIGTVHVSRVDKNLVYGIAITIIFNRRCFLSLLIRDLTILI